MQRLPPISPDLRFTLAEAKWGYLAPPYLRWFVRGAAPTVVWSGPGAGGWAGLLGRSAVTAYGVAGPFPAGLLFCRQTGGSKNPVQQALGVNGFAA
jgi:hypothetical protein